ncbi:MAG: hypothetical protein GX128_00910 [Bacteroidales bacterium]|jgi:hypothetical protein|nr:hypothetical protein [Bacteroidales bacterium]
MIIFTRFFTFGLIFFLMPAFCISAMAHSYVHIGVKIADVKLLVGGNLEGNEKAGIERFPTKAILNPDIPHQIFGGSDNLWGLTLTATARDLSGILTLDFTNQNITPKYYDTEEAQHEIEQDVMAMYAGNVNGDSRIRNNGPENDNLVLLSEILGNSKSAVLKDAYSFGDIEMNCIVKYNGPNNDHFYLLSIVLGNNKSKIIRRQY